MFSLILGNIFSLLAVICLGISVLKKNKKSLIGWQILDTVFCVASTFVLQSYSAVVTNSVSLARNIVAYYNQLSRFMAFVFSLLIVIVGLYLNNRGVIGYLPIIASVQYTICLYITKNEQQMRWALVFNLWFWLIHDAYIQAYPAAINDAILSLWTLIHIFIHKFLKKE
ncbi:MAG: YgjV family protein [Alphaproteobacteria bacterium]|nr:YgjV family protein [Alphaproteobacteria bacterium]